MNQFKRLGGIMEKTAYEQGREYARALYLEKQAGAWDKIMNAVRNPGVSANALRAQVDKVKNMGKELYNNASGKNVRELNDIIKNNYNYNPITPNIKAIGGKVGPKTQFGKTPIDRDALGGFLAMQKGLEDRLTAAQAAALKARLGLGAGALGLAGAGTGAYYGLEEDDSFLGL
jgi:hypothetical protein